MAAPLIGITVNRDYKEDRYWLPAAYGRRVAQAGGVPLLLPPAREGEEGRVLERLDGLLLSGGVDIAPLYFGEEPQAGLGEVDPERDCWEINLTREALRRGLPLLGICRGLQLLNVAAGGGLIQHLSGPGFLQHDQKAPRGSTSHTVTIRPATRLAALIGAGVIAVNSFHHQAAAAAAPGFQLSAAAPDGVIEALESAGHRFCLAVQWHPETLEHPVSTALFQSLVEGGKRQCRFF